MISPQCRISVERVGWTVITRQRRAMWSPSFSCWRLSRVKSAETRSASKPRRPAESPPSTPETPSSRKKTHYFVILRVWCYTTFRHECFILLFCFPATMSPLGLHASMGDRRASSVRIIRWYWPVPQISVKVRNHFGANVDHRDVWNNKELKMEMSSHCLTGCRTRWFDLDDPTRRGDYETLLRVQTLYPSQVCSQPVAVEAMTVSGVPAHQTGDVFQVWVWGHTRTLKSNTVISDKQSVSAEAHNDGI